VQFKDLRALLYGALHIV